ncbi:MAG TPA: C69 family dipeptidase [Sedimentisphaerales bacterium]|jgi:dipeptidase|nr:C69 family dipeptidase [Sedimentisphaerales bacterium]HNU31458.1 C69 family dipeptidase [Sedimentisphaerales bacterium]
MNKTTLTLLVTVGVLAGVVSETAVACTSLIVTSKASTDGSVFITYTCDGIYHPYLEVIPAADHEPNSLVAPARWTGGIEGKVRQAAHTYAVLGSESGGLMNDQQVAMAETTFGGREDLHNPEGLLDYQHLMVMALQRAGTAREAIRVIGELVAEYGYRSEGESFSIADKKEAWIMEMVGPGKGGQGAAWVALRIPDGYICCHANKARIGEFPTSDPANCLYSESVVSVAIAKGYFDPNAGRPFSFREAYDPDNSHNRRYGDARVWSLFRRAASSLNLSADFVRGVPDAEPFPLWIKPDARISTRDVFALMRDHYENTPYDMTQGIDAGPFGNPKRWRDLTWKVDGVEYAWERPISTQQTAYSIVAQLRASLPDPVGGVLWYGLDDTYTTCYTPLYGCIDAVPQSFDVGSLQAFSWDSAWWVFNFVANYACLKYSYMVKDIQAVQSDIETDLLALQPAVEATALALYRTDPALMKRYLTDYSVSHGESTVRRWRQLAEQLLVKYNDGYIHGRGVGYPEPWLRRVLKENPDQFRLDPAKP